MLSLLRLERQQKNALNPFRIGTFLLSYSFGIKLINMFIHSRSSLENHTRFQTKMTNVCIPIPVFRPKRRKNPTRWGSTYLYSLDKGVAPPPPLPVTDTALRRILASERQSVINFWAIKLAQELFFLCLVTLE